MTRQKHCILAMVVPSRNCMTRHAAQEQRGAKGDRTLHYATRVSCRMAARLACCLTLRGCRVHQQQLAKQCNPIALPYVVRQFVIFGDAG